MEQKRPRSREKNVTSGGNGVHKRGSGLGTGQVGGQDYSGKKSSGSGAKRAVAGGSGGALILVILFMLLKGGAGGLLGGNYDKPDTSGHSASTETKVDNTVAKGSREKRTKILGNNQDKITIMVYMCGTDLESKYKMASSDIEEMKAASLGKNIDIIIYTGGCSDWKSNGISSSVNQIYQIKNGKLINLVADDGAKSMTDPKTLSEFIRYCNTNFPANRNDLILWDHGGGSVSGYGYDEKYKNGSMNLGGINQALKDSGVTFDFIGFDACLMATAETAFMLDDYADYLIASEETEPGIGWYYTEWLSKLGKNTSMSTIDIGKNIIDDFVVRCDQKCKGQKTTLSIIDLAEFSNTVPDKLNNFAQSVSDKIVNQKYEQISDARYKTREFAQSSKIDQIDLVNFSENVGTPEGKELSKVLQNAIKYNRTSSSITNAYGVSIYFPYQRTSYVDSACNIYSNIGMDSDYSNCIRQFAKIETSGQVATASDSTSPLSSLFGLVSNTVSSGNIDIIGGLINAFKDSSGRSIEYMDDTSISQENANEYVSQNFFDASNLVWEQKDDGSYFMSLPESQWELVHKIDLNMFYDDGSGYIDLGLDNIYDFDDNGNLIPDTDRNWLAINNQPVAYYHTDTTEIGDDYTITGYVPTMLNGDRVNLILVFDNENPNGYIAGASTDYKNNETDTVPKSLTEINVGDRLDFLCDFYSYDGEYQDSYYLSEPVTVTDNMTISNVDVGDGEVKLMYRFTDIYNQEYWSESITK